MYYYYKYVKKDYFSDFLFAVQYRLPEPRAPGFLSSSENLQVYIRGLPTVSRKHHEQKKFSPDFFFKELHIKNTAALISPEAQLILIVFKNTISEQLMTTLEKSSGQLGCIASTTKDCRGEYKRVCFGNTKEKGGLGRVTEQESGKSGVGKLWIEKNQQLFDHISSLIAKAAPGFSTRIQRVPRKLRKFGLFSVVYFNATNISNFHRDIKDWMYCAIIPLGKYNGGELLLKYINVKVDLQRGDFALLASNMVFHNSAEANGDRGCVVLTNHTGVVNTYVED